jgi:hypothetical protein
MRRQTTFPERPLIKFEKLAFWSFVTLFEYHISSRYIETDEACFVLHSTVFKRHVTEAYLRNSRQRANVSLLFRYYTSWQGNNYNVLCWAIGLHEILGANASPYCLIKVQPFSHTRWLPLRKDILLLTVHEKEFICEQLTLWSLEMSKYIYECCDVGTL